MVYRVIRHYAVAAHWTAWISFVEFRRMAAPRRMKDNIGVTLIRYDKIGGRFKLRLPLYLQSA